MHLDPTQCATNTTLRTELWPSVVNGGYSLISYNGSFALSLYLSVSLPKFAFPILLLLLLVLLFP